MSQWLIMFTEERVPYRIGDGRAQTSPVYANIQLECSQPVEFGRIGPLTPAPTHGCCKCASFYVCLFEMLTTDRTSVNVWPWHTINRPRTPLSGHLSPRSTTITVEPWAPVWRRPLDTVRQLDCAGVGPDSWVVEYRFRCRNLCTPVSRASLTGLAIAHCRPSTCTQVEYLIAVCLVVGHLIQLILFIRSNRFRGRESKSERECADILKRTFAHSIPPPRELYLFYAIWK